MTQMSKLKFSQIIILSGLLSMILMSNFGSMNYNLNSTHQMDNPNVADLPDMIYATYFGASGSFQYDTVYDCAFDSEGNVFVGGISGGPLPGATGTYQTSIAGSLDAYIAKFSPDGSILYGVTFYGGNAEEYLQEIKVNDDGEVLICGRTHSSNLPLTANAYQTYHRGQGDIFLAKFSNDLTTLEYSSYFGGSQGDYGYFMMLPDTTNVFLAGYTWSYNFPMEGNSYDSSFAGGNGDIIILQINTDTGDLDYSTFMGMSGQESMYEGELRGDYLYMGGFTTSSNFPMIGNSYQSTKGASTDGLIIVWDYTIHQPVYTSYFGGNGVDKIKDLTVDETGRWIICGETSSTDLVLAGNSFQTTNGGTQDLFLATLVDDGTDLDYATYFGGSGTEGTLKMGLNDDQIALTGYTYSSNLPMVDSLFNVSYVADREGFYALFDTSSLTMENSGYFSNGAGYDFLRAIRTNGIYSYWLAQTTLSGLQTTANAAQSAYTSTMDGYLMIFAGENHDLDADGLPNDWETLYGLDPTSAEGDDGALGDPDDDGLTNSYEYSIQTNPIDADTDGDDLPDGWEDEYQLDPKSNLGINGKFGDFDGDLLVNYDEYLFKGNPRIDDTDGDSLSDYVEYNTNYHLEYSSMFETDRPFLDWDSTSTSDNYVQVEYDHAFASDSRFDASDDGYVAVLHDFTTSSTLFSIDFPSIIYNSISISFGVFTSDYSPSGIVFYGKDQGNNEFEMIQFEISYSSISYSSFGNTNSLYGSSSDYRLISVTFNPSLQRIQISGILSGTIYLPFSLEIMSSLSFKTNLDSSSELSLGDVGVYMSGIKSLVNEPDSDFDGLDDAAELNYDTCPLYADSDFDELSDSVEVFGASLPLDFDSDGDTIIDSSEVLVYGTLPMDSDTDNDGLSDREVLYYGGNALNALYPLGGGFEEGILPSWNFGENSQICECIRNSKENHVLEIDEAVDINKNIYSTGGYWMLNLDLGEIYDSSCEFSIEFHDMILERIRLKYDSNNAFVFSYTALGIYYPWTTTSLCTASSGFSNIQIVFDLETDNHDVYVYINGFEEIHYEIENWFLHPYELHLKTSNSYGDFYIDNLYYGPCGRIEPYPGYYSYYYI